MDWSKKVYTELNESEKKKADKLIEKSLDDMRSFESRKPPSGDNRWSILNI